MFSCVCLIIQGVKRRIGRVGVWVYLSWLFHNITQ